MEHADYFKFYLKYGWDDLQEVFTYCETRSNLSVLLEECLDLLHMQPVVRVWVPFKCWCVQVLVSEAGRICILLILHVVVCHSREFATFPGEVADVEGVMQWTEEEHAVCNK